MKTIRVACGAAAMAVALAGCTGTPTATERRAREDLAAVGEVYRPSEARPVLPTLTAESPPSDFVRYALLNSPRVEAAYYAWAASVERITGARSLPDPRLTFEADIGSVVESVMPGLMMDLPGPGKLRAAGDVAAAESVVGYHAFEAEVLRTAYAVKAAAARLHYLDESIRVQRAAVGLLGDAESLAQRQVGAGRATVQDVLRAEIERERQVLRVQNLEDSREVVVAEFRAALGHGPGDEVPLPARYEPGPAPPGADEVLAMAAARNPKLRGLEAEIRRGEAEVELARKARVPDFSAGIEADVDANPWMWRPSASMTLPIWKDKIRAGIAAAEADQRSARARLSAEQIDLAAELAGALYLYRESLRNEALYGGPLAERARRSLEVARAGYSSGRSTFLDVIEAERQVIDIEVAAVEARVQRELSIASISLLIAGVAPEGAPVLDPAREADSKEDRP